MNINEDNYDENFLGNFSFLIEAYFVDTNGDRTPAAGALDKRTSIVQVFIRNPCGNSDEVTMTLADATTATVVDSNGDTVLVWEPLI